MRAPEFVATVVPGHGPVGTRSEVIEFRSMLATVRDNVAVLKRRRSYEGWLINDIIPKRGDRDLSDVQARPVELWIESLT